MVTRADCKIFNLFLAGYLRNDWCLKAERSDTSVLSWQNVVSQFNCIIFHQSHACSAEFFVRIEPINKSREDMGKLKTLTVAQGSGLDLGHVS